MCEEVEKFASEMEMFVSGAEDEQQLARAGFILADPELSGGSVGSLVNSLHLFYKYHFRSEHTPIANAQEKAAISSAQAMQLQLAETGRRVGAALLVLNDESKFKPGPSLGQNAIEPCLRVLGQKGLVEKGLVDMFGNEDGPKASNLEFAARPVNVHPQEELLPFMNKFAGSVRLKPQKSQPKL